LLTAPRVYRASARGNVIVAASVDVAR